MKGEKLDINTKNGICRPTVRITKNTPTTIQELKPKEIEKAKREKYLKCRVSKFKTNN